MRSIILQYDFAEAGSVLPVKRKGTIEMAKGIVKWFNVSKGFGFIQPEGGGKDVFVHVTAVRDAGLETLEENQAVEFEMVDGRDGRQCAGEIKLTSG